MSSDYDVSHPPPAAEWLAMDEGDRVRLIEEAHRRTRSPAGQNPHAHATIHVVVENQLAQGVPATVEAYDRFRAAGVDRHVTVHALASVVARHMMMMLEQSAPFDEAAAARDFAALEPASFKRPR